MAAVADIEHGIGPEVAVVTFSAAAVSGAAGGAGPRPVDFSLDRRGVLMGPAGLELVAATELPRSLPLDIANSLAAAATALAAGASPEGCRSALRQFTGLPHRVELVAEAGGVRWYDDSKSTTPASVLAAVAGFRSVVLIAGGRNKGLDLGVLAAAAPPVRSVVAIGEAAGDVEAAFAGRVAVTRADTMEAAVLAADEIAEPGDAVLLSPGCASFDWYRSYAERGEEFTALVAATVATEKGGLG
jgi:UDP-N-acetylmuramoylalanine--D-glutamate ligase